MEKMEGLQRNLEFEQNMRKEALSQYDMQNQKIVYDLKKQLDMQLKNNIQLSQKIQTLQEHNAKTNSPNKDNF